MDTKEIGSRILMAVEEYRDDIVRLAEDLYRTPETGFREHETMKRCLLEVERLGLSAVTYPGTTGFTAEIDTGRPGPSIVIMGELDSVICFEHPDCNPETGAVHACGHHAQVTAMFGAAYGLIKSEVLGELCGKIILMGVPAEECLQLEWRNEQRKEGNITFLGGKAEFMERGLFDNVAAAMMIHCYNAPKDAIMMCGRNNGFVAKALTVRGRSAHAAGRPEEGINALYAAINGFVALNSLRETFKDQDTVRVHPIITKGGDIVNAIPEEVKVETLVRANSMDAVLDAAAKFDRAFIGGALSMGAKVEIETQPGFLPFIPFEPLEALGREVAADLLHDPSLVRQNPDTTGSSDIGDVCSVLPVIQPYIGRCSGGLHSKDFKVDTDDVYLFSSSFLGGLAARLLEEDGALAKKIRSEYSPQFASPKEYCDFAKSLFTSRRYPEE